MTSRSSQLLHLDPLAIALEKRKKAEQERIAQAEAEPEKQPETDSRSNMSSQPNMSWQPREQPPGGPVSNQLNMSNQPILSSQPNMDNQNPSPPAILASVPEIKGEARIPHRYTDHLCRLLKPDEQAVYLQLYRLSWGWGKETCFISNPRLSERSNVPLSSMKRAIAGLISKGLIEKTGHTNGFGKDQGVEYRVLNVSSQPALSSQPNMSWQPILSPIKEKHTNKHTHKGEGTTEEEQVRASRGVGVGSKFSLEECRRYADHLRLTGQGINNPGGYATTIHRTGEVDELIEKFLGASSDSPQTNASDCPDCQGTGFYYPKGRGQGVVKCQHSRLKG